MILWSCPHEYVRTVVVPEVTRGRRQAGKDLAGFTIMAAVPAGVGDDLGPLLEGVRSELHRYFGLPFYRAMFDAAGFGGDLAAYDAAAPDVEAQKRAISEELIQALCALGTVSEVRAGIDRYREAGATDALLSAVPGSDVAATLRAAAEGLDTSRDGSGAAVQRRHPGPGSVDGRDHDGRRWRGPGRPGGARSATGVRGDDNGVHLHGTVLVISDTPGGPFASADHRRGDANLTQGGESCESVWWAGATSAAAWRPCGRRPGTT